MKAVLCKAYGPPESLVLEEVAPLHADRGQVVIGVKACGVNFPDTLIIQGKYQFKPEMPFSPGGEVAGIVKEVGEGVRNAKVGDRVIAFTGWGGFAEEVVTEANKLIPIPDGMDFPIASAFVMVYGTWYIALRSQGSGKATIGRNAPRTGSSWRRRISRGGDRQSHGSASHRRRIQ